MQSVLYRQAAIKARADQLFGVSLKLRHGEGRLLSIAAILFLLVLSVLASFTEYAQHASAVGIVTTDEANLVQRAPRNGIVRSLQVYEGQLVDSEQLILELEPHRTGQNLVAQEADLADSAKREYQIALDASSLIDQQNQIELKQLDAQKGAAAEQLALLASRQKFLQEQLKIQEATFSSFQRLHKRKLGSELQMSEQRLAVLQTQQALAAIASEIQEQRDREILLALQTDAASINLRRQLLESRAAEEALGRSWLQASARADLGVVARVAGRVSAIEVRSGQQVHQGEPLFTLLPATARFVIRLEVTDRVIAKLRQGMPVRLRFDAYPWQKYGALQGTVLQFASAPSEAKSSSQAVWEVLVSLDAHSDHQGKADWILKPGLRVQADIELERQSLLRWMLGPLVASLKA